jgi:hypothetical protein
VSGGNLMLTAQAHGLEVSQGIRKVSLSIFANQQAESELNLTVPRATPYQFFYLRLVKQLAIKSDVIIENFKPGSRLPSGVRRLDC